MSTYLILGIVLFGGSHLFSTLLPAARNGFKSALGEQTYKLTYTAVSIVGVIFWVLAYRGAAPTDNLYEPWAGGRHLVHLAAFLMLVLIGASHGKGYIKKFVHHPMSIGILLWSGAHLLVNGEPVVIGIFATLFVVALADIIFSTARGKMATHEPRIRSDIIALVIGVVLFAVFAFGFHPYVLGVPVTG
jgi:uncharacterized membrane protein